MGERAKSRVKCPLETVGESPSRRVMPGSYFDEAWPGGTAFNGALLERVVNRRLVGLCRVKIASRMILPLAAGKNHPAGAFFLVQPGRFGI
jgi:hypothetical protein